MQKLQDHVHHFVFNQLSNVYDVTFNMVGNNTFVPGMHIYFGSEALGAGSPWQLTYGADDKPNDRSWANIMGLGGYHLVTEIVSSIAPGEFNTVARARWVTSGDAD